MENRTKHCYLKNTRAYDQIDRFGANEARQFSLEWICCTELIIIGLTPITSIKTLQNVERKEHHQARLVLNTLQKITANILEE